jgi:catechol 2,3-dioxygenase-like lactoylglutathione lyase family enzyme
MKTYRSTERSRRSGVLGIHSLDHFAMGVPDLSEARSFYEAFGLEVREEGTSLGLYTYGHPHRWATLTEAPQKRLQYLSFGAFGDDMSRFRERLTHLNIDTLNTPPGVESDGLWFHDRSGTLLEIQTAKKSSPDHDTRVPAQVALAGCRGVSGRGEGQRTRPGRLAHLLIFSRDVLKEVRFYSDVLGLRLSDRAGDGIAFLHGVHGSDHHLLAFGKADRAGLHHCSWDVATLDEVGVGAMQMQAKGYKAGWGVGRHVLGSNHFYYVKDPWNSYCEYSYGIDYVPAEIDWDSANHPSEDAFYLWGPEPPAGFELNHEQV